MNFVLFLAVVKPASRRVNSILLFCRRDLRSIDRILISEMANLDAHVASVLDNDKNAHSDDEDALIASLEDGPALDAFREQRIQQLHTEFLRAKSQKSQGFGNYTEIKEEKALMDLTTEVKYAVVHFAKDDFARCGVMDGHLEVGCPEYGVYLLEFADLR